MNLAFVDLMAAAAQIKAGKLRALASTGARRQAQFPDIPTFTELGVPGMDFNPWNGLFVPAATPPAIVRYLNAEVRRALQQQDLVDRLTQLSMQTASGGGSEEFASFVRQDAAHMARWIKAGNIRID